MRNRCDDVKLKIVTQRGPIRGLSLLCGGSAGLRRLIIDR
jgi:hypothetical protein